MSFSSNAGYLLFRNKMMKKNSRLKDTVAIFLEYKNPCQAIIKNIREEWRK